MFNSEVNIKQGAIVVNITAYSSDSLGTKVNSLSVVRSYLGIYEQLA